MARLKKEDEERTAKRRARRQKRKQNQMKEQKDAKKPKTEQEQEQEQEKKASWAKYPDDVNVSPTPHESCEEVSKRYSPLELS